MSFLLAAAIIGGVASTVGTYFHGKSKLNKERAERQEERSRLQKEIQRLLQEIKEKDDQILKLSQTIKQLDDEKLENTIKHNELVQAIATLEERYEQLNSFLTKLLYWLRFKHKDWVEEFNMNQLQLNNARLEEQNCHEYIARIDTQKANVNQQLQDEYSNREQLTAQRKKLEQELEVA